MADEDRDEIRRLIDSLQAGMVEMFDQLRELRRRLNLIDNEHAGATSSTVQLFTEVKKSKTPIVPSTPSPPNTSSLDQSVGERTEDPVSPSIAPVAIDTPETVESSSEKHPPISDVGLHVSLTQSRTSCVPVRRLQKSSLSISKQPKTTYSAMKRHSIRLPAIWMLC